MENTEITKTETPEAEISETQSTENKSKLEQKTDQPCKYYKADFILNPKILGFDALIIKTALEQSKKTEFTVSEAKSIATKFAKKEVKK